MINPVVLENEPPVTKLKMMIVGHEKNGKSRLAATAPKPVLFHDHDNRSEALNGFKGVYSIPYSEPPWPNTPEAIQDQLDILAQLEQSLDLHDLQYRGKPVFPDVPKGTILRTNVLDSATTLGASAQRYILHTSKDIRRDITIAGKTPKTTIQVQLPGGWDAWNAEMKTVENIVLRFLALPVNTILIMHESPEETPDSTPESKRFTGRVNVFPVRYGSLIKYFNEVWRVKLTAVDGRYLPRAYPLPSYEFDSATALLLDKIEEPNIELLIQKHEQRLKTGYSLESGAGQKQLPSGVKL